MDFGALPPEINSARIYAGPGSGPLMTAAAAWDGLAEDLYSTAASYAAVISALTSDAWSGPSSRSMAAAGATYTAWMAGTAERAEQAGAQARVGAAAYQSAFAMTVPPPVIAANRSLLAALVATNVLGQNTPAIAATEAQYGEMWGQDAAAMYGYAGSSATASQLTPFSQPAQTTNATGLAAQAAATAQASGTSPGTATSNATSASTTTGLSSLLSDLTSSTGSSSDLTGLVTGSDDSALGTFLSSNFFSTMVVNGAIAGGPFNPQFILQSLAGFSFLQGAKGAAGASGLLNLFNPGALGSAGVPSVGGFGSGLSAAMGEAGRAGALSVPPSWSAGAPTGPIPSALGGTPLAPRGPWGGGPGGVAPPMSNVNGRLRRAIPKYGMRLPPMMTRPPAAG